MSPKKAKPTAAATSKNLTPCEAGGNEVKAAVIRYKQASSAVFDYYVCQAPALVRVYIVRQLDPSSRILIHESTGQPKISVNLPPLEPGRHLLYWSARPASEPWQTRSDFSVDGTCHFLFRKTSQSNDPDTKGFLYLEVLA